MQPSPFPWLARLDIGFRMLFSQMEQSGIGVAFEDLAALLYVARILWPSTGTVVSPLVSVAVFGTFRREYPPAFTTFPAFVDWTCSAGLGR